MILMGMTFLSMLFNGIGRKLKAFGQRMQKNLMDKTIAIMLAEEDEDGEEGDPERTMKMRQSLSKTNKFLSFFIPKENQRQMEEAIAKLANTHSTKTQTDWAAQNHCEVQTEPNTIVYRGERQMQTIGTNWPFRRKLVVGNAAGSNQQLSDSSTIQSNSLLDANSSNSAFSNDNRNQPDVVLNVKVRAFHGFATIFQPTRVFYMTIVRPDSTLKPPMYRWMKSLRKYE